MPMPPHLPSAACKPPARGDLAQWGGELSVFIARIAALHTAYLYASPSLEEVGTKLRQNTPEIALVWRHGLRPRVALCAKSEAQFLARLLSGKSLLAALESDAPPVNTAPFDFQLWLPQAVQSGLLLGVRPTFKSSNRP